MLIGPFDQSITGPKRMVNDLTQNRLSYRMLTFRPVRRSQPGEIDQWDDLSSGVYFQTYDALITVIKTFLNTVIITTKEVMV